MVVNGLWDGVTIYRPTGWLQCMVNIWDTWESLYDIEYEACSSHFNFACQFILQF